MDDARPSGPIQPADQFRARVDPSGDHVARVFDVQLHGQSEWWDALGEVAKRPDVSVRLYIDTEAAKPKPGWQTPSAAQVAHHLEPGRVFRTLKYQGEPVRNHAKLVVVDHRFVLVTSANFSYSAAYCNIEFGIELDNPGLAESVERELRNVEGVLYERVSPSD